MNNLIGQSRKELEDEYNFDFYLETKDDFILGKEVDYQELMNSFIKFNNESELKIVRLYNGIIQEIKEGDLDEIKSGLIQLADNKGQFFDDSDDELATSYGFLSNEYFAEIMPGIIFMSGKDEYVKRFANLLAEKSIEHHNPEKISEIGKNIEINKIKYRKLGRNELCHCDSGKKYKKCCLDKDIKETGKARKVNDLWEDGYFAEKIDQESIKEKMKTFHKKHDEYMNYNCKKCNKKISAHNKDWHDCLCDECFNKEFHD